MTFGPVEVTGESINHNAIMQNLLFAFRVRLNNSAARVYGPDVGLRTTGQATRYSDARVTLVRPIGTLRALTDAVIAFEILSPTTERTDLTQKVQEHVAIGSIRRFCLIDSQREGITVFSHANAVAPLTDEPLPRSRDALVLPEIAVTSPLAELYNDVAF